MKSGKSRILRRRCYWYYYSSCQLWYTDDPVRCRVSLSHLGSSYYNPLVQLKLHSHWGERRCRQTTPWPFNRFVRPTTPRDDETRRMTPSGALPPQTHRLTLSAYQRAWQMYRRRHCKQLHAWLVYTDGDCSGVHLQAGSALPRHRSESRCETRL